VISIENPDGICINCKFRPGFYVYGNKIPVMTEITKGRVTRVSSQTTNEFSRKLPFISPLYCDSYLFMFLHVKGGFKLSFYGGLKMYDLGGLRTDRC